MGANARAACASGVSSPATVRLPCSLLRLLALLALPLGPSGQWRILAQVDHGLASALQLSVHVAAQRRRDGDVPRCWRLTGKEGDEVSSVDVHLRFSGSL